MSEANNRSTEHPVESNDKQKMRLFEDNLPQKFNTRVLFGAIFVFVSFFIFMFRNEIGSTLRHAGDYVQGRSPATNHLDTHELTNARLRPLGKGVSSTLPVGTIVFIEGFCPNGWLSRGNTRIFYENPPALTENPTCPTGMHSFEANDRQFCIPEPPSNSAMLRQHTAGIMDGIRGMDKDSRFSESASYIAGFELGSREKRILDLLGSNMQATVCVKTFHN